MRKLVNGLSTFLVGLGVLALMSAGPVAAAEACCYKACMNGCMQEHGFDYCHKLCDGDCGAC